MRGAEELEPGQLKAAGITPAHAGSRQIIVGLVQQFWDHPRACGEQFNNSHFHPWVDGSPPRMRGAARHFR